MPLIRRAAILAIATGCSTLNLPLLQHAYDDCIVGTVMEKDKTNPFSPHTSS